jgi:thiol-disulfide isomerase/thioredoxin
MTSIVNNMKDFVNDFVHADIRKYVSKNPVYILSVLIVTIIFILISVYLYNNTIKPLIDKKYKANSEFIDKNESSDILIYYFYTDWCPYCKKALPEWLAFKESVLNTAKYDASYNISFLEIDCEVDVRTATRFKIESYPTILIFYNGETYNYDAKPDQANLIQFLDGSLPISGDSKKWWDVF